MKRRISVPEGHVAILLHGKLADELMSLASQQRSIARTRAYKLKDPELAHRAEIDASIFGDLMLALLEAKES